MRIFYLKLLIFGFISIQSVLAQDWKQIGKSINGEVAGSETGRSVAINADGSVVACGAIYNPGAGGTRRGHVRVYKKVNQVWTQLGADMDGDMDNDWFGFSVALNYEGNILAVGATQNAGGGKQRGQVKVFQLVNGNWIQIGANINGENNGDQFGNAVSLNKDGNILAISSILNEGDGGNRRGHVRVFENISGNWTQIGADIDGEADSDNSGFSISLNGDGDMVAIGSPFNTGGGVYRGQVKVYSNAAGTWKQRGQAIWGESDKDVSGYSVSLSDDGFTLAIGAPQNAGGTGIGYARIYKLQSFMWNKIGNNIIGDVTGEQMGLRIALNSDGSMIAVSALDQGIGTLRGGVKVLKNKSNKWEQIGNTIIGIADGDYSGYSLALSKDGNFVAIGAPYQSDSGKNIGQIRVFGYPKHSYITISTCDSIISASGKDIYRSSGAYTDTLLTASGLDSLVTIYANINSSQLNNTTQYICKNSAANISIPTNNTGALYSLFTNEDTLLMGPVLGNGDTIRYTTPILNNDTNYILRAKVLSGAIQLDGKKDYISLGNPSMVDFGVSDFALEARIKLKDPDGPRQVIIGKDDSLLGRQFTLIYNGYNDKTANLEFGIFYENTVYSILSSDDHPITDTLWHQVLAQRVGNILELYLDGRLIKSVNVAAMAGAIQTTISELRIGSRSSVGHQDFFNGMIDEVRFWKKSLTAAEVKNNYNKCVSDTATGLIAYYKFDEPILKVPDSLVVNSTLKLADGYIKSGKRVVGIATCDGCEENVNVNIKITQINTAVSVNKNILIAEDTSATYQWINCNNKKSVISGATGKSYSPATNGNYAVIINKNGCVDTSACTTIGGIGISSNHIEKYISIIPNPTQGDLYIHFGQTYQHVYIKVRNLLGQEICAKTIESSDQTQLYIPGEDGIYMIELTTSTGEVANMKVVKNR